LSILQRAVAALARREHSRAELARKLARYRVDGESPGEIETALDQLEARAMLSDERFATALARNRGERFGMARVRQELRQHGIDPALVQRTVDELKRTELERARAIWRKKFRVRATDDAGRAQQMRFLATRGFSSDVIVRVVRNGADAEER
jgi:regulatory protein